MTQPTDLDRLAADLREGLPTYVRGNGRAVVACGIEGSALTERAADAIDQLRAERDRLREAFLETREMLGLAEQVICEECCPTTWKTVDGQPHCKLHEDICAVLFKYEKCRDTALGGEHGK